MKKIEIEPIIVDPNEREREIMQAAIEEVFEGQLNDEPEVDKISLIDTFLASQRTKCGNITTSGLERMHGETERFLTDNLVETGNSISLQRQEVSNPRWHQITMPEVIQKDLLLNDFEADLPEPSLDQIATLGFFDGATGRKMFDNIVDRDKQNEVRKTDEELTLPPATNDIPIISLSQSQSIEIPLNIDSLDDGQKSVQRNESQQQRQEMTIDNVIPLVSNDEISNDKTVANSTNKYIERVAIVAQVDVEIDTKEMQQPSNNRAKRRIRNRRENLLTRVCSITNFNKPLAIKNSTKLVKGRKNHNNLSFFYRNEDLNIFESISNVVEYNLPDDDEIEETPDNHPVIVEPVLTTSTNSEDKVTNKRRIASPELEEPVNSNKRAKSNPIDIDIMPPILEVSFLPQITTEKVNQQTTQQVRESIDINNIEIPIIESILDDNVARNPLIISPEPIPAHDLISTSKQSDSETLNFLPPSNPLRLINQASIASAFDSFRKVVQVQPTSLLKQVTEKDFEYSRLSDISKQINSFALPQVNQSLVTEEVPAVLPAVYRGFNCNGTDFVELRNKLNKLVKFEEYNLEILAMYMQIRKFMEKNGIWVVDVPELLNQGVLKLLHSIKNKHVIESRLWRLCDEKLFIGTWSSDELNLLRIEIPITFTKHSFSDSENKENVP